MKLACGFLDASDKSTCTRDQVQPEDDDEDSDPFRHVFAGWGETFGSDGCSHDGHRAQIHNADDEEDHRQAGTAGAAVQAEAQAVSPSCADVRLQRAATCRCLSAAVKLMCLPHGELQRTGDQDDQAARHRNGARQHRRLHLDRRQRDAQNKRGHSERGPYGEISRAH